MILGYSSVGLYTPLGIAAIHVGSRTITKVPTTLTRGQTYQISGNAVQRTVAGNGVRRRVPKCDQLSAGADHEQRDRPRVLRAARTVTQSMGVATGSLIVSTNFDVPAGMETGASTLLVVANGLASKAVAVTVH